MFPCAYAMNTFVSPSLGVSPYELVFLKPPPDITTLDTELDFENIPVQVREYFDLMQERFDFYKKLVLAHKLSSQMAQVQRETHNHPDHTGFFKGQLVLLYFPDGATLQTNTRKFVRPWIGLVVIKAILDTTHYMIADWTGRLAPVIVHRNRLKSYSLQAGLGEIVSIQELQEVFRCLQSQVQQAATMSQSGQEDRNVL